jgi:hypothetical protein
MGKKYYESDDYFLFSFNMFGKNAEYCTVLEFVDATMLLKQCWLQRI